MEDELIKDKDGSGNEGMFMEVEGEKTFLMNYPDMLGFICKVNDKIYEFSDRNIVSMLHKQLMSKPLSQVEENKQDLELAKKKRKRQNKERKLVINVQNLYVVRRDSPFFL